MTRLCIFRKKFKGRSKRDNMVSMGTVVLIGVRNWEVIAANSKKLENVTCWGFSPADVDKLRWHHGKLACIGWCMNCLDHWKLKVWILLISKYWNTRRWKNKKFDYNVVIYEVFRIALMMRKQEKVEQKELKKFN